MRPGAEVGGRALASDGTGIRRLGFVAVGDMTRVCRRLTPEIYGVLRAEGLGGVVADTASKDALTFVPFCDLPLGFKRKWVALSVLHVLEGRRLRLEDAVISCRDGLRRVWRSRQG